MCRWHFVWFAFALSHSILTHADDEEMRVLRLQMDQLKESVRQLQSRLNALEGQKDVPWVAATPPAPPEQPNSESEIVPPKPITGQPSGGSANSGVDDKIVILRKSWRSLSMDHTQDTVRDILGPPTREMIINGKTVWYYIYAGLGSGSVFFRRDGHVSSSQSPNLGWGY